MTFFRNRNNSEKSKGSFVKDTQKKTEAEDVDFSNEKLQNDQRKHEKLLEGGYLELFNGINKLKGSDIENREYSKHGRYSSKHTNYDYYRRGNKGNSQSLKLLKDELHSDAANMFNWIHLVAKKGFIDSITYLIRDMKIDPNLQTEIGKETCLHICLRYHSKKHLEIIQYLLTLKKINIHAANNQGLTAYEIARKKFRKTDIFRMFYERTKVDFQYKLNERVDPILDLLPQLKTSNVGIWMPMAKLKQDGKKYFDNGIDEMIIKKLITGQTNVKIPKERLYEYYSFFEENNMEWMMYYCCKQLEDIRKYRNLVFLLKKSEVKNYELLRKIRKRQKSGKVKGKKGHVEKEEDHLRVNEWTEELNFGSRKKPKSKRNEDKKENTAQKKQSPKKGDSSNIRYSRNNLLKNYKKEEEFGEIEYHEEHESEKNNEFDWDENYGSNQTKHRKNESWGSERQGFTSPKNGNDKEEEIFDENNVNKELSEEEEEEEVILSQSPFTTEILNILREEQTHWQKKPMIIRLFSNEGLLQRILLHSYDETYGFPEFVNLRWFFGPDENFICGPMARDGISKFHWFGKVREVFENLPQRLHNIKIVASDGEIFDCHLEVLLAKSNFFFSMINFHGQEREELIAKGIINLRTMNGAEVSCYLDFLYSCDFFQIERRLKMDERYIRRDNWKWSAEKQKEEDEEESFIFGKEVLFKNIDIYKKINQSCQFSKEIIEHFPVFLKFLKHAEMYQEYILRMKVLQSFKTYVGSILDQYQLTSVLLKHGYLITMELPELYKKRIIQDWSQGFRNRKVVRDQSNRNSQNVKGLLEQCVEESERFFEENGLLKRKVKDLEEENEKLRLELEGYRKRMVNMDESEGEEEEEGNDLLNM